MTWFMGGKDEYYVVRQPKDSNPPGTAGLLAAFGGGGCLHMKNSNGSFGTMGSKDLLDEKWLVRDKKTGAEYLYATIDELVVAAWVVD
jgi:hypothetical protein